MKTDTKTQPTETKPKQQASRVTAMQAAIDERDETIRLLNEALSVALDDINGMRKAA